jgi:hypothetical protein
MGAINEGPFSILSAESLGLIAMKLLMRNLGRSNPTMMRIAEDMQSACDALWIPAQAPWYTDHGPSHSCRIAESIEQLLYGVQGGFIPEPLHPEELLVLIGACYLHDIGMQFTRGVSQLANPRELLSFLPVSLFYDTVVRRRHAHIVHQLICDPASEPDVLRKLGLHNCPTELASAIAEVSLSHGISGYLADMPDTPLRLDLLGALLQLGDVLDLSRKRVNWKLMNWVYLPITSRAHWLMSTYVSSITIDSNAIISINYEVPLEIYRDAILAYDLREAIEKQWLERWMEEPRAIFEKYECASLKLREPLVGYSKANQVMNIRPADPDEPDFRPETLSAWRGDIYWKDEDAKRVEKGEWPESTVLRAVMLAILEYADAESKRRNYQSISDGDIVESDTGIARACGIPAEVANAACLQLKEMKVIIKDEKAKQTDVTVRKYTVKTSPSDGSDPSTAWYWLKKANWEGVRDSSNFNYLR